MLTSQPLAGLPSQSAKPAAQAVTAHAPAVQVAVALARLHARPQPPQFCRLVRTSVSQPFAAIASQSPKLGLHWTTLHIPPVQPWEATLVSAQALPQAPQWAGSMAVLAQNDPPVPVHAVSGAEQVAPHRPAEQTCPAAQVVPQAPQLVLSVRVLTSQPLAGLPSQSSKPAAQAITAHAPAVQVAVALARLHARPQPPQFCRLVRTSVSQPLAAMASQSPKSGLHRTTLHVPPEQPLEATLARLHAALQAPQLAGSMAVLAQYEPLVPVQVTRGEAQVAPQRPSEQTWPAGQTVPQAPQWLLSVCRLTQFDPHWVMPAPHESTQLPAVHVVPAAQAVPQLPQWALLRWRSTQMPAQRACAMGHDTWHMRLTQMLPAGQALPQAPQLRRSLARSAQKEGAPASPPPQVARLDAQVVLHAPRLHICPPAQALPQAPQWALSVCRLTQVPLHTVAPAGQRT
jgi:hypothetical protein